MDHFLNLFGDEEALEIAVENFSRIRQVYSQYFQDYLKEFEYNVALCGGGDTYTSQGKSLHLRASLNDRLKNALIGIPLLYPREYRAYVNALKNWHLIWNDSKTTKPWELGKLEPRFVHFSAIQSVSPKKGL